MLVLALDTATPAVTAALHDGDRVLATCTRIDARRHGELLAPAIATVLAEANKSRTDLTAIAVGVGPGPFTGLRVGLVTAKMLADVLGIELHGVCTLDVLARAALDAGAVHEQVPFVVATDARRKEVYWARYEAGRRVAGPEVDRPADVAWRGPAVGAGSLMYQGDFPGAREPALPDAAVMATMVADGTAPLLPAVPLYLRRPDAVEPGARKQVTPA